MAGIQPSSSVALLSREAASEALPTLVVQSVLVVNGRDPYISAIAADEVPEDLKAIAPGIEDELRFGLSEDEIGKHTEMPGAANIRYELAPQGTDDYYPLAVGVERHATATIERLMPGSPNIFDHELFADGDTRVKLDGEWKDETDFTVRGCFEADFEQAGNLGDGDPSDCRVFDVVLVREQANPSAASSIVFNKEATKTVGGSRLKLSAYFGTKNRLDLTGASSEIEGKVSVNGKLGKKFSLNIARAFGKAYLGTSSDDTGYELGVEAFNQSLLSVAKEEATITDEREFSKSKTFNVGGLGFGFGPVKIGITIKAGGEVFLNTNDSLAGIADATQCGELLSTAESVPACGEVSRQVTPGFAFTAKIFGGINLKLVKAGLNASLKLINTSFPLTASLAFGVRDDAKILAMGKVVWDRTLTLIKGKVSIVGKVGFRRWAKKLRVHLFSFSSSTLTNNMLTKTIGNAEVLE